MPISEQLRTHIDHLESATKRQPRIENKASYIDNLPLLDLVEFPNDMEVCSVEFRNKLRETLKKNGFNTGQKASVSRTFYLFDNIYLPNGINYRPTLGDIRGMTDKQLKLIRPIRPGRSGATENAIKILRKLAGREKDQKVVRDAWGEVVTVQTPRLL